MRVGSGFGRWVAQGQGSFCPALPRAGSPLTVPQVWPVGATLRAHQKHPCISEEGPEVFHSDPGAQPG